MAATLPDPCKKTAPTFPSGLETRQWCLSKNINQGMPAQSRPLLHRARGFIQRGWQASSLQIIVPIDRSHAESPGPYTDPDPGGNP